MLLLPQIMDNPLKYSPSEIRANLEKLGENLNGMTMDDAVLKYYEKTKGMSSCLWRSFTSRVFTFAEKALRGMYM